MKSILSIIFLALWLFPTLVIAGGPTFSRFGIGDLNYFYGSRSYAMGGTSIGLSGDNFINRLNPAGISKIKFTRFSGSFEFRSFLSSDASASSYFSRGDFQGLAIAIPIASNSGSVLMLDATPLSHVRYNTELTDSPLGVQSFQLISGIGGLSSYSIGTSYALKEWLSVGTKISYIYGKVSQYNSVDFLDNSFTDSEIRHADVFRGVGFTLGTQIYSSPNLTFGLFYSNSAKLSVDKEKLLFTIGSLDTVTTGATKVTFPSSYGIGFSYLVNNNYVLAADIVTQEWNKANFSPFEGVEYRNNLKLSFGVESRPQRESTRYWDRVVYQAGFGYEASYLKLKGEPVDRYYITGGVSLPIGPDARLNIGIQAGTRGQSTNFMQKDNYVRLAFTISASEEWFQKFEDD